MSAAIEKIRQTRIFLLRLIETLSDSQLNRIPEGFNNNIVWNLGHMVAAQQAICYLRANQKTPVPEKYVSAYSTNTRPASACDEQEIRIIKDQLLTSIDQFEADYRLGIFANYTPSPNILRVYNIELKTIDEAMEFILYHEGYHAGCISTLKRLVT